MESIPTRGMRALGIGGGCYRGHHHPSHRRHVNLLAGSLSAMMMGVRSLIGVEIERFMVHITYLLNWISFHYITPRWV